MNGNTELVEYGIHQEESDYRAHVCPAVQRIYVFPTRLMLDLVSRSNYVSRPAYTNGIVTARGYLVPVKDIFSFCKIHKPHQSWWDHIAFSQGENTSQKGQKAVDMVKLLIERGLFPLPFMSSEVAVFDLQVKGFDIRLNVSTNIQVKCDYDGGTDGNGTGTGNLYIQTHECNPFKRY